MKSNECVIPCKLCSMQYISMVLVYPFELKGEANPIIIFSLQDQDLCEVFGQASQLNMPIDKWFH